MKTKLIILFTLFSVFVLGRAVIFAQTTYSKSTKVPSCFSDKAIDVALENLPVNYHGNNLKGLIDEILRREKLTKDEFETTKQFLERVEIERKKNFLEELNSKSIFAFEVREGSFKYDADNELMNFSILLSSLMSWVSPCQNKISYANTDYKIFIKSMVSSSFPLKLNSQIDSISLIDSVSFPLKLNFQIEIEKAKRTKTNLRTLFIGNIEEINGKSYSYIANYREYRNIYPLNFLPKELWIYDITTGEIFLKEKIDIAKIIEETKKNQNQRQKTTKDDYDDDGDN